MSAIKYLLLSLIFLYISLPNNLLHQGFFAWIAFVPLLVFLETQHSFKHKYLKSWFFFQAFFLLFFHLNPFEHPEKYNQISIALILMAFYLIFPLLYAGILSFFSIALNRMPTIRTLIVCASFWALFEWGLSKLPIVFPLSLSISQYKYPAVLQIASITGAFGISFFIIFSNLLIATYYLNHSFKKYWMWSLLVLFPLLGGGLYLFVPQQQSSHLKLALIQPNIPWENAYYSFENNYFYKKILSSLSALTQKAISHPESVTVIWPELCITDFDTKNETLKRTLDSIVEFSDKDILLGARVEGKNKIIGMNNNGIIGAYNKSHFVPFFESNELYKKYEMNPIPIQNGKAKAGVFLCYEVLFQDVALNLTKNGADIIGCLSFNTWLGINNWPLLHMAYLPLRAVETGRSAFFLNNNGPLLVVDSRGRVNEYLSLGESGYAIVDLNLENTTTIFSILSPFLPFFFLISTVVAFVTQRRGSQLL